LDVTQELPSDLPPVKGDLNQLADSLFNLFCNAYDAAQKKASMIELGQLSPSPSDPSPYRGRIHLRARVVQTEGKPWVTLEVQDNGMGMSEDELGMVFLPFFTTKATAQKGTGLGLYVIQRIVELHKGKITVNSKYGFGTTFVISLPAYQEEPRG